MDFIRITCTKCSAKIKIAAHHRGRRFRCPRCASVLIAEPLTVTSESEVSPVSPESPIQSGPTVGDWIDWKSLPRRYQWHVVGLSLIWAIVAFDWTRLEPWITIGMPIMSSIANLLPLAITIALIAANLLIALVVLGHVGRNEPAIPSSIALMLLFGLLFFQIAHHLGASHFAISHHPSLWEWGAFTLGHAFRAADVFDSLQDYGLQFEMIHSRSHTAATTLIFFRIVIDLIFVKLIVDWLARGKQKLKQYLRAHEWSDDLRRLMSPIVLV